MALEDLDLEFEDEEEQKQDDAISVDVDLSFSVVGEEDTSSSKEAPAPISENKPPYTPAHTEASSFDHPEVANLEDARLKAQSEQRSARPAPERSTPKTSKDSLADVHHSNELEDIKAQLKELKEQMSLFQEEGDKRLAVQKAKSDLATEFLSDAKLLDHQVNAILKRIHSKVPGLKNEVLMINKYMKEFLKNSSSKK